MIGSFNPAIMTLVITIGLFVFGIFVFVLTVILLVYFSRHCNTEDPMTTLLRNELPKMSSELREIEEIIKNSVKEPLQERRRQ